MSKKTGETAPLRNTLTLDEKLELIDVFESRKLTIRQIQQRFRCGKTQIYETIRKKADLIELRSHSEGSLRRVVRSCTNEEVNNRVYGWYLEVKSQNLPISGPSLQARAKSIAEGTGNLDFKASNGWLSSFRRRYGIQLSRTYYKTKDVELASDVPRNSETSEDVGGRYFGTVPGTADDKYGVFDEFARGDRDETDESILQQLPDLGIVKREPYDPQCSSSSTPANQYLQSLDSDAPVSYEVPLSPSSILPDIPSRHSPPPEDFPTTSHPSATKDYSRSQVTAFVPTAAGKRRRSKDGDDPLKLCSGCGGVRDEFAVFGEFVAAKLRNLKTRRNQLLVQNAITKLLIEAEMKDIDDEAGVSRVSSTA